MIRLPLVVSDDYAAFKCICEPRISGNSYNEYWKKICIRRDALQALGVKVEFVQINPHEFWAYFTDKKPATWPDLLRYTFQLPSDSLPQGNSKVRH